MAEARYASATRHGFVNTRDLAGGVGVACLAQHDRDVVEHHQPIDGNAGALRQFNIALQVGERGLVIADTGGVVGHGVVETRA